MTTVNDSTDGFSGTDNNSDSFVSPGRYPIG